MNALQQYIGKPYIGDALTFARQLPDESVHCVVTSPPYFNLRDYGVDGQYGLEDTPTAYVARLVELFTEVRRVLRRDGTFWLNLGDGWASSPHGNSPGIHAHIQGAAEASSLKKEYGVAEKNLLMIPARVAIALQDSGWYLRDEIVWHKPNPMPASVKDRTTRAHEMVYLLTKEPHYHYDAAAIAEPFADERMGQPGSPSPKNLSIPGQRAHSIGSKAWDSDGKTGRNRRSVWTVTTEPTPEAHFATYPTELIKPMILAGCPPGGVVYDPFLGSGTTAVVAEVLGRQWIGSELNPDYLPIILKRLEKQGGAMEWLPLFATNGGAS